MNWKEYHKKRQRDFLNERRVKSIRSFSDDDMIVLAELDAVCYSPKEDDGWVTRKWLENIHCVHHHGCCTGCEAIDKCRELSSQ